MLYRPLLILNNEEEYREYYYTHLCAAPIETFDGFLVTFHKERFEHAFFESVDRKAKDKSRFSITRAQRMSWIIDILKDPNVELKCGYLKSKKRYDPSRRVCFVTPDQYVVVIQFTKENRATFITAFVPDSAKTFHEIRNAPDWRVYRQIKNIRSAF